ncbi:hypothetical protein SAMN04487897_1261 [Paenibacillus sp. yr247]|nr:hypothetical protein SAMN04487897_1261 [Paenibacillus sp. yr247]
MKRAGGSTGTQKAAQLISQAKQDLKRLYVNDFILFSRGRKLEFKSHPSNSIYQLDLPRFPK